MAPAKVFLCGEYAVLEGAPALVAASSPLASARWSTEPPPADSLIGRVLTQVRSVLLDAGHALPPGGPKVDTSTFFHPDGRSIGLGSSAAAASAAITLTAATAGADLQSPSLHPTLVDAAIKAHRQHQGGVGSGADVAASMIGGIIRFSRSSGATPMSPPTEPAWSVVQVGPGGASSRQMVEAVMSLDATKRAPLMAALANAAQEACEAFRLGRVTRFLQWIEAFGDGLERLGAAASSPIVTRMDKRLAEIARRFGGVAKPSGAGGGELAVLFAPSADQLQQILEAAAHDGISQLPDWAPSREGARVGTGSNATKNNH